ncbi:hypothetical protein G7054_g7751 [Neopestalotiopsis clavispora]|nr:hypothetical protein G7054_g7751 [Neopestalotiopsis clavispora]
MRLDTRSTHPAKKAAASSRPTRPSLSREDATLGSSCTTSPDHDVSLPEARTASRSNTIVACPCRDAAVTVTTSSTSTTQGDEKNDTIVVICPTAAGYLAAAQKQQQRLDDISVVVDDEGNDADDEEWAAESFDPDAVPIRLGSSRLRTGSWRGDDFVRESGCASAPTRDLR